jgi:signal transduction histidine kinase
MLPNDFFSLVIIGILVMMTLALSLVIFFYTSQRRLLKEKNRQQELQIQHQKELLYSTILTQEKERKRIAKDLHDEIGSKLNVVFLNLYRLQKQTKAVPEAKDTIKEMTQLINTTIGTTRQISHDLLPPTLDDFGLTAAIQELSDAYAKTGTINIDFDKTQALERLSDKTTELNLFRVVQELVKNSIVHGQSKNISIQLSTTPPNFNINYQDDGRGFDMSVVKAKKGLGTQNIESRLNMSNADIEYETAIGEGVKAHISNRVNTAEVTV